MPRRSEEQRYIETLEERLREMERADAGRLLAAEEAKREHAQQNAALAAQEARDKALEKARATAWLLANFDKVLESGSTAPLNFDELAKVGAGWPPGTSPDDVRLPSELLVQISEQQSAETTMGRLLRASQEGADHVRNAGR